MHIATTRGEMDDAFLEKRVDVWNNDDHRIEATEYCVRGCPGEAHRTGIPQGDGAFCEHHVRRDVQMTLKRWPIEAGAVAASLV